MYKIKINPAEFFVGHVVSEGNYEKFIINVKYNSQVRLYLHSTSSQIVIDGLSYLMKDKEEAERVFKAVLALLDNLGGRMKSFLESLPSADSP